MMIMTKCSRVCRPVWALTVTLFFSLAIVFTAGAGTPRHFSSGDKQVNLVELFTSQGCSSCPPAELWLGSLKEDPRLWKEIVPIAFHVDYWDYIGWKDIYAKSENSSRQRRYRDEKSIGSVYTPGFVVNGREWRGWFRNRELSLSKAGAGRLQAVLNDGQLQATYSATEEAEADLTLHVALLGVGLQVEVTRGENSGRRLPQDFIVLEHLTAHSSNGSWSVTLPAVDLTGDSRPAIALWVSDGKYQKPLQAVGGWLDRNG